jgi:dolichol-phosphate mannosyltransferase
MERPRVGIVVPALNEAATIAAIVERISPSGQAIVVDDGSTDATAELARQAGADVVSPQVNQGYDGALNTGFARAKELGCTYIITMDADLSHDPKLIPYFLKKLKTKKFVIGSRYIIGGKSEMKLIRLVISFLGNKFIKFVLNIKSNEFTTSYRGFRIDKMTNINFSKIKSKGYSFFMETLFLLHKNNINITEIPIHFRDRYFGVSKIPKIEIFRTLYNLFRLKYFAKV